MRIRDAKKRFAVLVSVVAVTAAVAVVGSSTTGAYFSDSKQGNLAGTIGSIKITGSGGSGANGLNISYSNLLPGEAQTASISYTNTGLNKEDVWVVFNNADALHALNDLGRFGEFHVSANGTSYFDSANLNDGLVTGCVASPTGCWPVPRAVKLVSGLSAGASGDASFTFAYSKDISRQSEAGGGVWNSYPLAAPTNSGLPYQLVATQVGQTP